MIAVVWYRYTLLRLMRENSFAFNKAFRVQLEGTYRVPTAPVDRSAHVVFRWLIDSPIFSLRSIGHAGGRCVSHGRGGAGGNSEGEHPGAQRRRSSDTTTAHGRRQHREGFPGGQCPIIRPQSRSTSVCVKLSALIHSAATVVWISETLWRSNYKHWNY